MTAHALRRLGSRRGNVMVHVLVTSIIVMIIAAGLMRLVMVRYVAIQRLNDGGANKRLAEAALAEISGRWSMTGACTAVPGFTLAGTSCAGGNTCTLTGSAAPWNSGGSPVTVSATAGSASSPCRVTVTVPGT